MKKIDSFKVDNKIIIKPHGQLDFHCHREFINTIHEFRHSDVFVIDLSDVDVIDSSACGILLQVRDYSYNTVKIINYNKIIDDIFKIVKFNNLFELET